MSTNVLSNYVDGIIYEKGSGTITVRFIVAQDVYLPVIEEITLMVCSAGNVKCYKALEKFARLHIDNKYTYEQFLKELTVSISDIVST
jgi:hypothetical protein